MNRPKSPKPPRASSRTRASQPAEGPLPKASGLPTEFGPVSSERSRSARRQRPDEAPEGGDDQHDRDFVDDVDYTEEDVTQEQVPVEAEEGFHDDDEGDIPLYAERIGAMEERVMVSEEEIQANTARPHLVREQPPWWDTLMRYEPSGGITRGMCENRQNWDAMETGVRDPGYTAINTPLMYEPVPTKSRNIAHDVRRGAIIAVMEEMGYDNFVATIDDQIKSIDDQIKSGEAIEWDDPDRGRAVPIVMDEPNLDMKMNYYVKLRLPDEIEAAVWEHTDRIATETHGKRLRAKINEAFDSFREEYSMRVKAHTAAIKHGFPSYTQRWFERPIYRYQQACSGLGPFFCVGGRRPGEMTDASMFNKAWMLDKLSPDGRQAAETYLEIWNGWCRENVQGRPIAPIGGRADRFNEQERHLMFKNDSGLVPAHMPWIIRDAVAWMKRYPCLSNIVPTLRDNTVDQYGRQLREGTINMRFQYLAEGRDVGAMTLLVRDKVHP
eukprot:5711955-Amphidinium_carterae.2